MTYEESEALMKDIPFRGRIKVAAIKYAEFLLIQPVSTEAINTKRNWARNTQAQPDTVAAALQPTVVMDGQVQADGASITDAALQTTVETVVNRSF